MGDNWASLERLVLRECPFLALIFFFSLYSKQAIHPSQVDIIQSTFVPTSEG
jgi:hypothetical protein